MIERKGARFDSRPAPVHQKYSSFQMAAGGTMSSKHRRFARTGLNGSLLRSEAHCLLKPHFFSSEHRQTCRQTIPLTGLQLKSRTIHSWFVLFAGDCGKRFKRRMFTPPKELMKLLGETLRHGCWKRKRSVIGKSSKRCNYALKQRYEIYSYFLRLQDYSDAALH